MTTPQISTRCLLLAFAIHFFIVSFLLSIGSIYHSRPACAASKSECLNSIKPLLKNLNDEIDLLLSQLKETPASGPRVSHGECTKRLVNIEGMIEASYKENAQRSAIINQIACLRLKKLYARRTCECSAKGLEFDASDKIVDESIEALKRLNTAQKLIRKLAIKDKLVRSLIDAASEIRDCYSARTIVILNEIAKALEEIAAESQ